MKKQNGFTLIELLVVVGVVALIASMVIVSVSRARGKSRDTKRVANLDAIRGALELYKDAQGTYPATTTTSCWIDSMNSNPCTIDWSALQTALQPYIQVLPSDPKTGQKYYYEATASNYKIMAILENETDTMNNDGSTGTSCNNYYEVYSLQAKDWSCSQ